MILSPEQRMEKAVQHLIVFAQFLSKEYCQTGVSASEVLCTGAARAFGAQRFRETGGKPVDWTGEDFAQYMRQLVIDGAPVEPPGIDAPQGNAAPARHAKGATHEHHEDRRANLVGAPVQLALAPDHQDEAGT